MRDYQTYKDYDITYETFRVLFNKDTCMRLESVVIYDPDNEPQLPRICFANKGPSQYDKRLIDTINFEVIKRSPPLEGYGVRAIIHLKTLK